MRRLKILFFWIFFKRNNVSFSELLQFLVKPTIHSAKKKIESIEKQGEMLRVKFHGIAPPMYWPESVSLMRLYQVMTETFDPNDWHYYQKEHTEIHEGDILLDIGTAEGLFPLTVTGHCNQIYLVEPSRIFTECLKRTFAPFSDKVTLFNTAVGNEDGEISFDENSLEGKVGMGEALHKVNIHKIDTLFSDKHITYLKADIEGYEQEMLRGAAETIRRNKPRIAITTYHTENDPQEIIDIVTGFVPEYKYYVKGIYELTPKPVMIHFWV